MQQSDEMIIAIDKRIRNIRKSSAVECVGSLKRKGNSNRKGMDTDIIAAILKPLAALTN